MALPKLETPTYELELPSTGEKIKYRPFLVKEQKVLMMAQGSKNEKEISNSIGTLVSNCTFNKIDPVKSPMFDIEYIFLKLRAKSVGETVELSVTCPDDGKTTVPVKVNLDEINVQMTTGHTNVVDLSNDIKMYLRYPLLNDMQKLQGDTEVDKVFNILLNCIHEVHHGDKIYNAVDVTKKDLETFVDQMTTEQLRNVMDFFQTMPKLRHVIQVTNPNTKKKGEVVVEGLQNFLE
tara:strand:- start:67 stop:771 length:705 start_codon:yes stop_codon:yes gene_type:complete